MGCTKFCKRALNGIDFIAMKDTKEALAPAEFRYLVEELCTASKCLGQSQDQKPEP